MDAQRRTKALIVYERLIALHGVRPLTPRREPLHELISTILSHRTTGKNEAEAYQRMWDRFGSWEAIRDAPLPDLIEFADACDFPRSESAVHSGRLDADHR